MKNVKTSGRRAIPGGKIAAWLSGMTGRLTRQVDTKLRDVKGQGTTEYAILVGVLVVIAIVAISAFKKDIQGLWDAIKNGLGSL